MLFGGNAGVTAQQNAGVGPGPVAPGSSGASYEPPQKVKDMLAKQQAEKEAALKASGLRILTKEDLPELEERERQSTAAANAALAEAEAEAKRTGALTTGDEQGGPNAEERAAADAEFEAEAAAATDATVGNAVAGGVSALAKVASQQKSKPKLQAPAPHKGNVTTPDLSYKGGSGGALFGGGAPQL